MKRDDIFVILKESINELLQTSREKNLEKKQEITGITDLYEDLEIDSLEAMDLIALLEEKFNLELDAQEVGAISKVDALVDYFEQKVQ